MVQLTKVASSQQQSVAAHLVDLQIPKSLVSSMLASAPEALDSAIAELLVTLCLCVYSYLYLTLFAPQWF